MGRRDADNEQGFATIVGTSVEVRTRFEVDLWVPGFEITDVLPFGFRVRRTGDGAILPETFPPADVRLVSPMHSSGPFRNPGAPIPPHAVAGPQGQRRVGLENP